MGKEPCNLIHYPESVFLQCHAFTVTKTLNGPVLDIAHWHGLGMCQMNLKYIALTPTTDRWLEFVNLKRW